jgi:hypothetical protein
MRFPLHCRFLTASNLNLTFDICRFQKFDFGFEEEDSIDGMKKLIVEEVNSFRAEVRAQARASGQIRRQERYARVRRLSKFAHQSCFQPSHSIARRNS